MPRIAPRPQAGPARPTNAPPSKRAQRAALAIAFATLAACDATDADPADVLTLPDVAARVAAQALTDGAATCGPDAASVLAHWTFDGATSPVLDDGPDAHDGALTGGTLGVTGMRGGAIDCGGTAAIDFGAGPDWDRSSARTLAAWVNVPAGTTGLQTVIAKVGAGAAGSEGVWFGVSSDLHPVVREYSTAGFEAWQASTVLTTDTWHHIAFTIDDGLVLAWVDGEVELASEGPSTSSTVPGVLSAATTGCSDTLESPSMLKIDDVWMLSGLDFSTVPRLMDGETQASALDCGSCGHACEARQTCELGSCVPATCGAELSAYWALDEGAGTVGADAVGATHAVGIGAGSSTGSWGEGRAADTYAAVFGGGRGAVAEGVQLPPLGDPLTLAFWVRPDAVTSAAVVLAQREPSDFGGTGWTIRLEAGGAVTFEVQRVGTTGPEVLTLTTATTLAAEVWGHVAVVFDDGPPAIYVNGTSASLTMAGTPPDGPVEPEVPLTIGGPLFVEAGVTGLSGRLSDVAIFGVALDATAVATLASAAPNALCAETGLLACGAGTASCDDRVWTGCETTLASSVHNCGGCGRDCGAGGFCSGGLCMSADHEVCGDALDNDGDGDTDCDDSECVGEVTCQVGAESTCLGGVDDDADGDIDCADFDCRAFALCTAPYETQTTCNDGLDNDADGYPDCADSDCSDVAGCPTTREWSCDDPEGVDEDLDGDVNCDDSDCAQFPACLAGSGAGAGDGSGDGSGMSPTPGEGSGDPSPTPGGGTAGAPAPGGGAGPGALGGLGDRCTNDEDCFPYADGPFCAPEAVSSVPGGFCTAKCTLGPDEPCPSGSRCTAVGNPDEGEGFCLPTCLTTADCVGPDPASPVFEGSCRQLFYGEDSAPLTCRRMCDDNRLDARCTEPLVCDPRYLSCMPSDDADGCVDADSDGWPDCETAACWQICPSSSEIHCEDGFDNDGDGDIDCDDSDCGFHQICTGQEVHCGDGLDDDGDGDVDCDDIDCAGRGVCDGEDDCGNGLDDNFNGYVDCHDFDCLHAPECANEAWCGLDEGCCTNVDANGDPVDDDGDGFANCMDPDCAMLPLACPGYIWGDEGVETDCGNFDDDDWDGWIDCLDPDCANTEGCEPGTMPLGGPCTAHSDCEDGAFAGQPMCLMTQPGSVLAGTCTQTCKLDDPVATCSQDIDGDGVDDGYRCIDTGFGGGMGLCLPACVYDSDCLVGPFAGGAEANHCEDTGLGLSIGVCRTPECAGNEDCAADYYCAESVGRCRLLTDTIDEWMPVQIDEVPIVAGYRVTWDPNAGTATARPLQTWEYDGQDPRFVRDDLIRLGADLGALTLSAASVASCSVASNPELDGSIDCLDVIFGDATGLGLVAGAVEVHAAPANPRLLRLTDPVGSQLDLSELLGADPRRDPLWGMSTTNTGDRSARVVLPTLPGEIELDIWVRAQAEVCGDGEDNDEDSLVDEGCRSGELGDTCGSDFDCGSGICDAGTCAPPHLGDWRTVGVYDVTLATPNSETLIPSKDVIDWPSGADPYLPQGEPLPLLIRHPLGLTPEDCDVDDVYPYDRNGVTCLPLELEWQGTQQDNLPVWVELTTDGAGELLYTGLLSGGPWPELGDLDKLPNAPTGGRSLRGRVAPPGVQSRPATFYFPDAELLSGSVRVVVRSFVPASGPGGERSECDATPGTPSRTEEGVYRISDPTDFQTILHELGWTPAYLARTFTNMAPTDHYRGYEAPGPDFAYLIAVFGCGTNPAPGCDSALDRAFGWPIEDSMRDAPEVALSLMSLDEQAASWAELLRPRSDGTGDAYWGLRAVADHAALHTRGQRIAEHGPDGWGYDAGRGSLSLTRTYVFDASGSYALRQFTTDAEVPYYGPNPGFSSALPGNQGNAGIPGRDVPLCVDGSGQPLSGADPWFCRGRRLDNAPHTRVAWPPVQFVGSADVVLSGCSAALDSSVSTAYFADRWNDGTIDLPACVDKVALEPVDETCGPTTPCPAGSDCVGRECVARSCAQDSECPSGSACRLPAGQCASRVAVKVNTILRATSIDLVGVERFQVHDLSIFNRDAEAGLRYDRETAQAAGNSVVAWNDFASAGVRDGCQNAVARAQAEAWIARGVERGFETQAKLPQAVRIANSRSVTLSRVRVFGGEDGVLVGGDVTPAGPSTQLGVEAPFGGDHFAFARWLAANTTPPGTGDYAPWRYASAALREPLCAASCATLDVSIDQSWFFRPLRLAVTLSYARRVAVTNSVLAFASTDTEGPFSTAASRSLLWSSPSSGTDWEPNNSRRLPRVRTALGDESWWYDNGQCERFRSGDATFFNCHFVGNLEKAATFDPSFGLLERIRIVRSSLVAPHFTAAEADRVRKGGDVLTGGGREFDIVDSYIDGSTRDIRIWLDGGDGVFTGNTVLLGGQNSALGFDVVLDGPTASDDEVSCGDPDGPAGDLTEPEHGAQPYFRCDDVRLARANDYWTVVNGASMRSVEGGAAVPSEPGDLVAVQGDDPSVAHFLPARRGYDWGWPLRDDEMPVRVVADNDFVLVRGDRNGACIGGRLQLRADVIANNRVRVIGRCGQDTSNATNFPERRLDLVAAGAPVVVSFMRDNDVSWYPDGAVRLCGNGVVDAPEECDDGDHDENDGCRSNCTVGVVLPTCLNGVLDDGEECDPWDWRDMPGAGWFPPCTRTCRTPGTCGNGLVDSGAEACDDFNTIDGDGCSAACLLETSALDEIAVSEAVLDRADGESWVELRNDNPFPIRASAVQVVLGSVACLPSTEGAATASTIEPWSERVYVASAMPDAGPIGVTTMFDPDRSASVLAGIRVQPLGVAAVDGEVVRVARMPSLQSNGGVELVDGAGEFVVVAISTPGVRNGVPMTIAIPDEATYRALADGRWEDDDEVGWRMDPLGLPHPDRTRVSNRAMLRRASYGILELDGLTAWDDGVEFPHGRFDGVPRVCVEMTPPVSP
ncbi:MAG: hypothetical protein H6697_08095 [Myxococcales bacterium]|nr:hypothetical protein [Myxococcales bacterium]